MSARIFFDISSFAIAVPGVSADGYVRLDFRSLLDIPLFHLLSGLDDDPAGSLQCGSRVAAISGFTEWVSQAHPVLTIGWDWVIDSSGYQLIGKPRSNIMLVDANANDLGPVRTEDLLIARLARMPWQETTGRFITSRYI